MRKACGLFHGAAPLIHNSTTREMIDLLEDEEKDIEYSIVSLWESEIKHKKHPDEFVFTSTDIHHDAQAAGYLIIDLEPEHIFGLSALDDEKETGHKDPFDRMLIAQARSENMLFVTRDRRLLAYNEPCVKYWSNTW